jgi:hypothetical protein
MKIFYKILRFSSKNKTFLKICQGNRGGCKIGGWGWWSVVVVPFFFVHFFYFPPNFRATKRARLLANKDRPSVSLHSEKIALAMNPGPIHDKSSRLRSVSKKKKSFLSKVKKHTRGTYLWSKIFWRKKNQ